MVAMPCGGLQETRTWYWAAAFFVTYLATVVVGTFVMQVGAWALVSSQSSSKVEHSRTTIQLNKDINFEGDSTFVIVLTNYDSE
eukprot:1588567-Heterocapsa_arctica.AAC.1